MKAIERYLHTVVIIDWRLGCRVSTNCVVFAFYKVMDPKQFKASNLRAKTIVELDENLRELRRELAALRVNQVSSAVASKLAKIGVSSNFSILWMGGAASYPLCPSWALKGPP